MVKVIISITVKNQTKSWDPFSGQTISWQSPISSLTARPEKAYPAFILNNR
mgnify:CR=1 FL=1